MRDEEQTQQDDEAVDVSPAAEAAFKTEGAQLPNEDPDLVEAAREAEQPDDEE
ncbi:MAG: hypothetical protein M3N04_03810 [Actinomycetota bacterium]|nr:hypothetical protein [Actinomycetota bacterium]